MKRKAESGEEPYGWYDFGATSTFVAEKDVKHTIKTGLPSNKKVKMPNGQFERGGEQLEMRSSMHAPANKGDSIPGINTTLVSTGKLADAGYVSVFDQEEVNVYDVETTKVLTTNEPIWTGWRDKATGLWRIPLVNEVKNETTDTKLLSAQDTSELTNEIAANVHDLPSTQRVICYLHAAAGFPTKDTWIKAIKANFFSSWPMLTEKAVRKHFPESEETQKGHMKQKRQGVRKTNRKIRFVMEGNESASYKRSKQT